MLTSIAAEPLIGRAAAEGVVDPRRRRHRMIVLPAPMGCSTRAVLQPLGLNDCREVEGADLGLLLSAWGECDFVTRACAFNPCAPAPLESQSFGGPSEHAEAAIGGLLLSAGFASIEEFTGWLETASATQVQAMGVLIVELAVTQNGGGK